MKLLEAQGITLLPEESSRDSPLTNLMQSGGQRLALTEAGKRALGVVGGPSKVVTSRPIVVSRPVATTSGSKVTPKLITLDKSGGVGVRRVVTTVQAANPLRAVGGGQIVKKEGGVRRISVSPAQLMKLKEMQKGGGTIQMKKIIVGEDGRKRILVEKSLPASAIPGLGGAVVSGASGAAPNVISIPAAASSAPRTISISPASAQQPAIPGKTQTVKIIRMDKETGQQTVSRVTVPLGAKVVPAGSKLVATTTSGAAKLVQPVAASTSTASPTIAVVPKAAAAATEGRDQSAKELAVKNKQIEDLQRKVELLTRKLNEKGDGSSAEPSGRDEETPKSISSEDID